MILRLKQALHRRRHPDRYSLLDGLLHNQSLNREQLLLKQQRDLAALIAHAYQYSPYYREKYAQAAATQGLAPTCLPLLKKDEVIQHREEMLSGDLDKRSLKIGNTGGSTGKLVSFYYDEHKSVLMRAGMMRSYMWSGWRPGQKILNFWGARQDLKGRAGIGAGVNKRFDEFVAAERTIGAYEYTEAQLHSWAEAIRSYRPVLLQGYASILAELAGYITAQKIAMPRTLLGVYSTAEVLYPRQRETMEQAFGCKVFNQYGSREIPNIAVECRHGNQHVFTDMVWLESLKIEGEDRLVVTSLTNRAMPFIRYEIGDSGRLKDDDDCPCGSPFPLMEMGLCRSNDLIRTRSGKHIYPSYFTHLLDGLEGISQFQFVQSELDKVSLSLVAAPRLDAETVNMLRQRISWEVDERMVLEIDYVDEIKRSVSGKHRFVISELD